MANDTALLVAYAGLSTMACLPIVLGSIASVEETKKTEGKSSAERMGSSDAYMFPLIGSATLVGFYVLFKYFNPEYINMLLSAYFSFFGLYAVSSVVEQLAGAVMSEETMQKGQFWAHIGGTTKKPRWQFEVTAVKFASWLAAAALTGYYVWSKNWIASNVLAMSFATSAITLIHLDSFKTGFILLAGLLIYDIFWVFGTNVMVKVAKSFDVPVKLLFPKNLNFVNPKAAEFCLLGLGDIVIPGVFVALCHRFDAFLAMKKKANRVSFFAISMSFYILGLMTTMAVMHIFKAAQPALLYLSPACLLAAVLGGLVNGNLKEVYNYEADAQPEKSSKNQKSPAKKTASSPAKGRNSPIVEVSTSGAASRVSTPRRTTRHTKAE